MSELNIQWDSVIAKNEEDFKIYCTELNCEYRTDMKPNSLIDHCTQAHNWGEYKCPRTDNCKYTAYTRNVLKQHVSSFHKNRKTSMGGFHCPAPGCAASLGNESKLRTHMNIHSNTPRFKCWYCLYTSENIKFFEDHLAFHHGELEYKCEICDFISRHKRTLDLHMDTHNETKYKCTICSKIRQPHFASKAYPAST